ncbi:hypothetical protein [uncultured Acetobacteroides sp.]|uniref:hypothetical protein n=1 Tax=uncultured Acetobacteroides sp. TaxID=1760811 RepID=UPI0029F4F5F8|nr:hypothetical protein [uncultured Acetobacteroides sp.]
MANNSKISFGNNASENLDVASKLVGKHKLEGAASPLHTLPDVNWTEIEAAVPKAMAKQREAEEYRMKSDMLYRERDNLLAPIVEAVRLSKNLLKTIHSKNPKALSEWGFEVTYSAPTKPSKTNPKKSSNSDKKEE